MRDIQMDIQKDTHIHITHTPTRTHAHEKTDKQTDRNESKQPHKDTERQRAITYLESSVRPFIDEMLCIQRRRQTMTKRF